MPYHTPNKLAFCPAAKLVLVNNYRIQIKTVYFMFAKELLQINAKRKNTVKQTTNLVNWLRIQKWDKFKPFILSRII
ncbi:hypothetical protein COJ46_05030 [Bacillus sp. AFS077874]|nr:hypothetical protein CON00_12070 [Bacillus sp. AFS096315]PFM82345.1 hypothetical protein COJ46_05030 [Bacillus sp. AFS077874]